MKTVVLADGHEIMVERTITEMVLYIDGTEADAVRGIFKKDNNARLKGTVVSGNSTDHQVFVDYVSGGLKDIMGTLTFWYDGKKIDVRSIL